MLIHARGFCMETSHSMSCNTVSFPSSDLIGQLNLTTGIRAVSRSVLTSTIPVCSRISASFPMEADPFTSSLSTREEEGGSWMHISKSEWGDLNINNDNAVMDDVAKKK